MTHGIMEDTTVDTTRDSMTRGIMADIGDGMTHGTTITTADGTTHTTTTIITTTAGLHT